MNADVIVTPILDSNRTVLDGPFWMPHRPYANPRAGEALNTWGPDTLTSDNETHSYCCGELLGVRLTMLGAPGYVKLWVTGERP